jgi:HlyD family secretion protein
MLRDQWDWTRVHLGISQGKAAAIGSQYVTAPVEQGELRRTVTATGTLNAIVNVEVGSQLSGQIAELLVDFNDEVKKGQPLARLDQRTFKARVADARAAVAMAEVAISVGRAKLERARVDAVDSESQRAILQARTDNARVKLQAARNDLKRKEALRERQINSAAETEDAQTRLASAEAALREAEAIANANENKIAGAKADLRRAESELEAAIAALPQRKAQLEVAEIDLDRATIRSPIDGVVVGRKVNEGQTLATTLEAKTLFIVAGDLRQMQIEAKLDEADIGKIQIGQEAAFTVDAHPGRQFAATVRQVRKSAEVQQNVVTYTVVLSAANPDNLLLPGMTALTRITVNRTGPVVEVPLAALRYTPNGGQSRPVAQVEVPRGRPASVWVVGENGEPKAVVVGVGEDDASHAAILSGALSPGDRVIVSEAADPAPRRVFGIRVGF